MCLSDWSSDVCSSDLAASAGTPLNTGPVVSVTVMFCVWAVALPQLSVAVQVRCRSEERRVGKEGVLVGSTTHEAETPLQASLAVTVAGGSPLAQSADA